MQLQGIEHHTVIVNSIKLHYVEAGQGPAVVLLHGFPETWFAWRKQIPVLAQRYRVIVPDLRGYGDEEPSTITVQVLKMWPKIMKTPISLLIVLRWCCGEKIPKWFQDCSM
jgi:pimeloyl-ACP methyl ester carboxylesterase